LKSDSGCCLGLTARRGCGPTAESADFLQTALIFAFKVFGAIISFRGGGRVQLIECARQETGPERRRLNRHAPVGYRVTGGSVSGLPSSRGECRSGDRLTTGQEDALVSGSAHYWICYPRPRPSAFPVRWFDQAEVGWAMQAIAQMKADHLAGERSGDYDLWLADRGQAIVRIGSTRFTRCSG